MTIATTLTKVSYFGDGEICAFPIPFPVYNAGHLKAIITHEDGSTEAANIQVLEAYTGTQSVEAYYIGNQRQPLPAGDKITFYRDVEYKQELDLKDGGSFHAESLEATFDLLVMQTQQLKEEIERSVKVPITSDTDPNVLFNETIDNIRIANEAANTARTAADQASEAATQAQTTADNAIEAIQDSKTTSLTEISSAGAEVLTNIDTAKSEALDAIEIKNIEALATIDTLGGEQVQKATEQADKSEQCADNATNMLAQVLSVGSGNMLIFESSGTFTVPHTGNYTIICIGGGGGNGYTSNGDSYSAVRAGSGSGYMRMGIVYLEQGQEYPVIVGAAGANNATGGTSSFNGLFAAAGGEAGESGYKVASGFFCGGAGGINGDNKPTILQGGKATPGFFGYGTGGSGCYSGRMAQAWGNGATNGAVFIIW